MKFFCGRHEALLNNMKSRWFINDIENFLTFFQEPWTELIMHDHFEELHNINADVIRSTAEDVMRLVN